MEDLPTLVGLMKDGLSSVVIIGLYLMLREERKRTTEQTDGRIGDNKAHAAQMLEITRTIDKALQAIRGGQSGSV